MSDLDEYMATEAWREYFNCLIKTRPITSSVEMQDAFLAGFWAGIRHSTGDYEDDDE